MSPLAGALAAALVLAGAPAHPTVYAASSLTEVFPRIDPQARYSFAGSDQLAFQIEQGAPADIFAAASPKYSQRLFRKGLVGRPVAFATNSLVLLVPASNPAHLETVYDLRRRGVKLVVAQKGVPIGDYTRTALAKLGLTEVLANVVSEEPDAKGIVGKVVLGQADAGFVYSTDGRPVARKVKVIRLPARAQPDVRYELAVVRASKHPEAARAFVRRVLGGDGRSRLAAAGFGVP